MQYRATRKSYCILGSRAVIWRMPSFHGDVIKGCTEWMTEELAPELDRDDFKSPVRPLGYSQPLT